MGRTHYPLSELGSRLKDSTPEPASHGRILVVDGEGHLCRRTLADSLPHCRFTHEPCPDAARQLFLSSPYDLVLLSHSERIDCLEWLSLFKSLRPTVSVIVTTTCGCEELAVQAFRLGAIDYFSTPFEFEDLETSIRAVLQIRRECSDRGEPLPVGGAAAGTALHGIEFP